MQCNVMEFKKQKNLTVSTSTITTTISTTNSTGNYTTSMTTSTIPTTTASHNLATTWSLWYTKTCILQRRRYMLKDPSKIDIQNVTVNSLNLCDRLDGESSVEYKK